MIGYLDGTLLVVHSQLSHDMFLMDGTYCCWVATSQVHHPLKPFLHYKIMWFFSHTKKLWFIKLYTNIIYVCII
jgi:hypothetical protein